MKEHRQVLFCALLSAIFFASFGVEAKAAKRGAAPRQLSCPAANKVNTAAQDKLGCPVVLARTFGPQWEPATKADFIKQSGGRPFGEMKAPGMGGLRCAKFFKKKTGKVASLYRLYGGGAGQFGGYWTFEDYAAGDTYRKKMAICKSWNDFSSKVTCTRHLHARSTDQSGHRGGPWAERRPEANARKGRQARLHQRLRRRERTLSSQQGPSSRLVRRAEPL